MFKFELCALCINFKAAFMEKFFNMPIFQKSFLKVL